MTPPLLKLSLEAFDYCGLAKRAWSNGDTDRAWQMIAFATLLLGEVKGQAFFTGQLRDPKKVASWLADLVINRPHLYGGASDPSSSIASLLARLKHQKVNQPKEKALESWYLKNNDPSMSASKLAERAFSSGVVDFSFRKIEEHIRSLRKVRAIRKT